MTLAPGPRPIPLDAFCGTWRRSLQTRIFGTYAVGKDESCTVAIDLVPADMTGTDVKRKGTAGVGFGGSKKFRWSFGKSVEAARVGFVVQVLDDVFTSPAGDNTPLRVSHAGRDCYGMYQPDLGTLVIHLTGTTNATLVYRMLDDDTIAVSITEVPNRGTPVIQHGFMFRHV